MKLNTEPIYKIRSTKGFSLNEELRAWDGVPEWPTVQEPVDKDYSDRFGAAEVKDFYAEQDEIVRAAEQAQERETFDSRLKHALQSVTKATPVGRSKRSRVIFMSQLPRDTQSELAKYVGFRGA